MFVEVRSKKYRILVCDCGAKTKSDSSHDMQIREREAANRRIQARTSKDRKRIFYRYFWKTPEARGKERERHEDLLGPGTLCKREQELI